MKAKTVIDLLSLSSTLYLLTKDTELMSQLKDMAEKGKDKVNSAMSEPLVDEDGNEMEFVDKLIHNAGKAKEHLEERLQELVAAMYDKMHIAHTDEVNGLKERLTAAEKQIALLEARLNRMDQEK